MTYKYVADKQIKEKKTDREKVRERKKMIVSVKFYYSSPTVGVELLRAIIAIVRLFPR